MSDTTIPNELDIHTSKFYAENEPPAKLSREDFENICAESHAGWMEGKRAQGVTSRLSEWGEELMVEYWELSEAAKDLDRYGLKSSFAAIENAGYRIVPA